MADMCAGMRINFACGPKESGGMAWTNFSAVCMLGKRRVVVLVVYAQKYLGVGICR